MNFFITTGTLPISATIVRTVSITAGSVLGTADDVAEIDEIRRRVPMRDKRAGQPSFRNQRKDVEPRGVGRDDHVNRRQRIDLRVQRTLGVRLFGDRLNDQLRSLQRLRHRVAARDHRVEPRIRPGRIGLATVAQRGERRLHPVERTLPAFRGRCRSSGSCGRPSAYTSASAWPINPAPNIATFMPGSRVLPTAVELERTDGARQTTLCPLTHDGNSPHTRLACRCLCHR